MWHLPTVFPQLLHASPDAVGVECAAILSAQGEIVLRHWALEYLSSPLPKGADSKRERRGRGPSRWAFFHLRLWAFELKLWMDGLSWEQVRIAAESSKDLAIARATHEKS